MSMRNGRPLTDCRDHGLQQPIEICGECVKALANRNSQLERALGATPEVINKLAKLLDEADRVITQLGAVVIRPAPEGEEVAFPSFAAIEAAEAAVTLWRDKCRKANGR